LVKYPSGLTHEIEVAAPFSFAVVYFIVTQSLLEIVTATRHNWSEWMPISAPQGNRGAHMESTAQQVKCRDVLTVEEFAARCRISRGTAYKAVAEGQISSVRIGKRILIPVLALERLLTRE